MFRRTFLKLLFAASNFPSTGQRRVARLLSVRPSSTEACDLRCEYRTNPLGIETDAPILSWRMADSQSGRRGVRQTAYRVIVATTTQRLQQLHGDLWDSGVVLSCQAQQIRYSGAGLQSEQTCHWKVRIRDDRGVWTDWSESASWTMGLLDSSNWIGFWIGSPIAASTAEPAPDPWLRKQFALESVPECCLLHVASIGFHELYVNGKKIGSRVLSPSVSNLKHRVRYVTYDITPALCAGQNVIGIWLGTSWSIFPAYQSDDRPAQPLVKVQGTLRFRDGTFRQIVSDTGWKTASSPNRLLGTWRVHDFGGEYYDASQGEIDWASPDFNDAAWKPVKVVAFHRALSPDGSAGNVLARLVEPVGVERLANGSYRVDMGINYAGWFQMDVTGEPGAEVRFQFSENESEASTYAQRSTYIVGPNGKGTFSNRFNYMAGRWITVEGLAAAPKLTDARGWNVRTPYERTSSFSCDQSLLNQIYETTLSTFESLTLGNMIVDCPHRERTGYGDAEEALRTGVNSYDLGGFLSQWAQDWRDVQAADGNIPYSAPTETGGGGPAWSAFCITLPWRIYQRYGDVRVLRDGFPTMQRWLAFLETHAQEDMLVRWGSKWSFLGDWQWPRFGVERAQMERAGKSLGDTPEALFFDNCYWVHALRRAAEIAEVLGRLDEAAQYRARANQVAGKLHARFFKADEASYVNGFPAYLAIALRAEVPPSNLREAVWKRLEDEILVKHQGHIWAGIIGGVVLMDLLLDHRRDDLIYAMASKTDYPSWGEILKTGHTTFTEGWGGTGSGLHSSFLYIGSWFIEGLAGIRQTGVGFQHFEIDPCIDLRDGPKRVKASVEIEYGRIRSAWKRSGNAVVLEAAVPPNTVCLLRLRGCVPQTLLEGGRPAAGVTESAGAAVVELQPGSYNFAFRANFSER